MSPRRVVHTACRRGLNLIAVVDHNASAHAALIDRHARDAGVWAIPGVEATSREGVHLLALFDSLDALEDFQHLLDAHLPADPHLPDIFGHQVVYDAEDRIVDLDDRLRQTGTDLAMEALMDAAHARGGAVIPSHIERARHSLLSQLGLIDPEASFDALEITRHTWTREAYRLGDCRDGFPLITGSDAHFLNDIGAVMLNLAADAPTLNAWRKSLNRRCDATPPPPSAIPPANG